MRMGLFDRASRFDRLYCNCHSPAAQAELDLLRKYPPPAPRPLRSPPPPPAASAADRAAESPSGRTVLPHELPQLDLTQLWPGMGDGGPLAPRGDPDPAD